MRSHYPLALALLFSVGACPARPAPERRAAWLALDFCGVVIGETEDTALTGPDSTRLPERAARYAEKVSLGKAYSMACRPPSRVLRPHSRS